MATALHQLDANSLAQKAFEAANDLSMTQDELGFRINIDAPSIEKSGIPPRSIPGQLALQVVRLRDRLFELLRGNPRLIHDWMTTPRSIFCGQPPVHYMVTAQGLNHIVHFVETSNDPLFQKESS